MWLSFTKSILSKHKSVPDDLLSCFLSSDLIFIPFTSAKGNWLMLIIRLSRYNCVQHLLEFIYQRRCPAAIIKMQLRDNRG